MMKIQPGSSSQEFNSVRDCYSRVCFQNNKTKSFSKAPVKMISIGKKKKKHNKMMKIVGTAYMKKH